MKRVNDSFLEGNSNKNVQTIPNSEIPISWEELENHLNILLDQELKVRSTMPLNALKLKEIITQLEDHIESSQCISVYGKKLTQYLNHGIRAGAISIPKTLLSQGVDLGQGEDSSLNIAGAMANIEVYDAVLGKILQNPSQYSFEISRLQNGAIFINMLIVAIRFGNTAFVKHMLQKHKSFYLETDNPNNSPINLLFANAYECYEYDAFCELHAYMLKEGFSDLNFNVRQENISGMFATLFKFQDVDRIMKMLQEGKDLKIFDDLFNSPQELIKKGESIRDITVLIFKNAFKHKEKLMISPEHLHPNDRTYTHATIANMHPSLKNAFKNIFIQLLEKMPLGSTVLKLENEKKIYQKIIAFLNKQDRLFLTHLDRLDVAFQLIRMFRNPECLDQGNTHLCGVATFLQFLIEHTPLSCLEAMMDYCETGYTKNPNLIKYSGKFADDSLVFQSFIQAFKHTNSFYGYYPSYEPMEAITGATKSKSIAEWMEKAGFSDLEDTWALKNPQGQELPLLYRGILGGMYSKYHRQRTHEEQLSALLEAHEQGKAIALNISPLLANRKLFLSTEEEAYRKEMKTKSILGLVYSHWVNLKDIQFHAEEQLVHFKYYTYGKIYSGALPVQYFLKEIYGMVAGTPPTQLEPFIECSTSLSPPL